MVLGKQEAHYSVVRLSINTMLENGNDCKIRAIEIGATQPPLTLKPPSKDIETVTYDQSLRSHIYVWGLNDSDQILKRQGRLFTPAISRQLSSLKPKSVVMTSKVSYVAPHKLKCFIFYLSISLRSL